MYKEADEFGQTERSRSTSEIHKITVQTYFAIYQITIISNPLLYACALRIYNICREVFRYSYFVYDDDVYDTTKVQLLYDLKLTHHTLCAAVFFCY